LAQAAELLHADPYSPVADSGFRRGKLSGEVANLIGINSGNRGDLLRSEAGGDIRDCFNAVSY
jgi:hypothetical protein